MRPRVVLLALAVSACGGSSAPPPKPAEHVASVEVPAEEPEPSESPGSPTQQPREPGRDDFAGCIASLRSAADVAADGPDRSFYDAGLGAERAGDTQMARKSYYELISKHPRSKLIPLAYLAFGEIFAAEAVTDPSKWDLARAAYAEVAKYPPPENTAYYFALLQMGVAGRSDPARRLSEFAKAAEGMRQDPSSPCAALIAEQARDGMVLAYTEAGSPEKAWAFFRASLGDKEGASATRALVRAWLAAGKRKEACAAAKAAAELPDVQKEGCAP